MTKAEVKRLLNLELGERLALVQMLWESIRASEEKVALSPGEERFIDKRLRAYEKNPADLLSWDDLRSELWPEPG